MTKMPRPASSARCGRRDPRPPAHRWDCSGCRARRRACAASARGAMSSQVRQIRALIGEWRFDGNGARRPAPHVVIREVRRRQHDLVASVHERRQRGGKRVIGAGGDDQILGAARRLRRSRPRRSASSRVEAMDARDPSYRHARPAWKCGLSGAQRRRRRWKERQRLSQRDDVDAPARAAPRRGY